MTFQKLWVWLFALMLSSFTTHASQYLKAVLGVPGYDLCVPVIIKSAEGKILQIGFSGHNSESFQKMHAAICKHQVLVGGVDQFPKTVQGVQPYIREIISHTT